MPVKLLEDILVVDFSQFLSGPSASLRLADMGARVIKIERPGTGDICRELYVSDVMIEGESTIFHAINRNKQSFAADLKKDEDLRQIKKLLEKADVVIHNFRPGVMERLGLGYAEVKKIKPGLVYAGISGYGEEGPWKDLPGQDLLLQAVSGLTWLSNNSTENPTPMGVAVVDILAGTHLAQGILAALFQQIQTGEGALVEVSMFESVLDFQFEVLTCFYNDGRQLPQRGAVNSAHTSIAAPYGIYQTKDDYLALAMTDIPGLARLLACPLLEVYTDSGEWYAKRDEIKTVLAGHLQQQNARYWLDILETAGIWCAPVMDYDRMTREQPYRVLEMETKVQTSKGLTVSTTRCPVKIDGRILPAGKGAPQLGEHNDEIAGRYGLREQLQPVIK